MTAVKTIIEELRTSAQDIEANDPYRTGYLDGLAMALAIAQDRLEQEKFQIISSFNHGSSGFSIGRDGERWYQLKYEKR